MLKPTVAILLLATCCCTLQAAEETVNGRYVHVSIPGQGKVLSLAEVQVLSAGKNVARGKATIQSSVAHGGAAGRAVDGDTNGEWGKGSITHTAEVTDNPAWEVDLGKSVAIETVIIWNRDGYEKRLNGCRVAILDKKRTVVWGVDLPSPGSGATELAIKNYDKPEWASGAIAKITPGRGDSGSPANVSINTTESLRLAINDLIATHGNRYPQGNEFLARLDALDADDAEGLDKLRQEALLANPLLDFDKLLFIKRRGNLGLPQNWQGNCALGRGGYDNEIAVLSPVKPGGASTTLFKPEGNRFVGDVDLHFDGDRLLFSMRNDTGRFQIHELTVDGKNLRQVTPAEPDIDNYDACYLPNGKIIFDSTAVFAGVPCVGGSNQVANLYVMDETGDNIRQLCFDQDHNWCPSVMADGRVMYSRWEYSDTPHYFTRVVFQMNPDGTGQKALYGSNSLWPNSTFYARAIPGHPSKFVGVISGHHGVPRMGELVIFDPALGEQEADGAVQRIPGHGQKVEPRIVDQLVNNSWPKFLHPYPLSENYFLVSAQLDSQSPWGIYLVDVFDNMLPILLEPGLAMLEPIPLRQTPRPPVIADRVDMTTKDAVVYLDDIYAGGGLKGIPRGTVKSLRLFAFDYGYHGLANHTYIGIEGPWDVHRILGTVPVEEDGSSVFKIPANTPIAVQPLDSEGRALQLMRSWFVGMPGERVSCVGCHERNSDLTRASRSTVASQSLPREIAPWYGPARGFSFEREVQPVVDTHCVGCHDGAARDGFAAVSDLRSEKAGGFSKAYTELQKHVRRPGPESDYHMMPPAEYHASTSPLIQMLAQGHHGVQLDREARERLYTWIDLNVPFYGTWGEFRPIPRDQHARRAELRRCYAGVDLDYEVVPELPSKPIQPIVYQYTKKPASTAKVECPGWPFDAAEARRRQGQDSRRKITIGTDNGQTVELTFVRIPASEFVMGDVNGPENEQPCRAKIEKPYWISATVITNQQFQLFDRGHDSRYLDRTGKDHSNRGIPLNQPNQPVVRVSWRQAMAYCQWLSRATGGKFSLPSEAQWEFACRAGAETANGGAWGIGRIPDSVAEWTQSAHLPYPYDGNDGRAEESATGQKVVRGGLMINDDKSRQSTLRQSYAAWQGVYNVGFRIICEDEPVSVVEKTASVTKDQRKRKRR